MNYEEALQYIYGLKKYQAKPRLDKIRNMLEIMGNPQNDLHYVHVGGTNGKGGTVAMCRSVMRQAGYTTGGFVSPYLQRFNERIQVNGEPIPDEDLTVLAEYIKGIGEEMLSSGLEHPTRFETITAMAFKYWHDRGCDLVGLEVGLGGKKDATNIIPAPEAVILTAVARDHTHILGNTLAEITQEKCGIIKPGSAVICYPEQAEEVFEVVREVSESTGNSLIIPAPDEAAILSSDRFGTVFQYRGIETKVPMMGRHQVLNALCVIEAMRALREKGWKISDEDIAEGIRNVEWPGRMERVSREPECILDGAHNPRAVRTLARTIDEMYPGRRIISVMGIMKDKDYHSCIPEIAGRSAAMIAVKPAAVRGLPAEICAQTAKPFCTDTRTAADIPEAVDMAFSAAGKDDLILITGSLYVVGGARTYILKGRTQENQNCGKTE